MTRSHVNKDVDKKVFARTARRTKAVNLGVFNLRGGIRF